ncbi:hypothetical protein [Arthrobacter globiformis]|uniref:hypothetical protein n=1 Tax=Arthrobacter globiformis TaxID=1665 RepID=UPI0027925F94|nr:hypothetical protein [Arthrobacter globiformis]MDQ0619755.1 hypothetical protein [Arthrobacter globiformis]
MATAAAAASASRCCGPQPSAADSFVAGSAVDGAGLCVFVWGEPERGEELCAACGEPEAEAAGAVVVPCPGSGAGGVHDATANSAASAAAVREHAMPERFLGEFGRLVV